MDPPQAGQRSSHKNQELSVFAVPTFSPPLSSLQSSFPPYRSIKTAFVKVTKDFHVAKTSGQSEPSSYTGLFLKYIYHVPLETCTPFLGFSSYLTNPSFPGVLCWFLLIFELQIPDSLIYPTAYSISHMSI